jgi:hypothetical protein
VLQVPLPGGDINLRDRDGYKGEGSKKYKKRAQKGLRSQTVSPK